MSAALLIDILLWGSVAAVGFIAYRRGPAVLTASMREGTMDFINIVPRIGLGVVGSGYIAAVIPQEIITGWLGPDSGWLGVLTAVIAGGRDAGRAGGRFFDRRGGAEGRRRHPAGDRLCNRLGAVRLPAADIVGNPVHAGALRLVPRRRLAAVPVSGRRDRDGDRETVRSRAHGLPPARAVVYEGIVNEMCR
jgi:hypothetical protein